MMEIHEGGRLPLWGTPQNLLAWSLRPLVAVARQSRATRE